MITKKAIIEINKKFDNGSIINGSSLEFALSSTHKTKDWVKKLSYIIRSILIDHVFEEGNKRTAAAVVFYFFEEYQVAYDPYKVDKAIAEITFKNINSIEHIRRKLKDAVR